MSPDLAQRATDYIFQQQAVHQPQSQSQHSYYQDIGPTDTLSDRSSGRIESTTGAESLSDLSRDPHLSAYMIKPSQGEASFDDSVPDDSSIYAESRRKSDGQSMFEGFTQNNPCKFDADKTIEALERKSV